MEEGDSLNIPLIQVIHPGYLRFGVGLIRFIDACFGASVDGREPCASHEARGGRNLQSPSAQGGRVAFPSEPPSSVNRVQIFSCKPGHTYTLFGLRPKSDMIMISSYGRVPVWHVRQAFKRLVLGVTGVESTPFNSSSPSGSAPSG